MNNACIFCHQIRGTTAAGQNAPDLTHFASRRGIAANTVPNTKGNLAGWILDPQSTKPGNHMATIAVKFDRPAAAGRIPGESQVTATPGHLSRKPPTSPRK